jgi:4-amino-4-deoxy-L-arabinose transferase-like glycosyltransferase
MNKSKVTNNSYFKDFTNLIILGILILASYLRLVGVFTKSFAFTYDVGRDMLALSDIVHFVHFPFIGPTTGIPGVFYGPWWYWLLAPFFFLFGGNPEGIAFVMAVIGIVTIILAYIFGKRLGGEFLGLSFAALIAVSPVMISLASQIWNPNIAPFFVLVTFIILERIFSQKKPSLLNFFFLGILLMLSADIEIFYGSMFTMAILLSVLIIKKLKINKSEISTFIAGSLIILSPRILFEIKNHFLMTKSLITFIKTGSEGAGFLNIIPERLHTFLDNFSGTVAFSNLEAGAVIFILMLVATAFFYGKLSVIQKNFVKTSGIVLVVFFLGTALFSHDIWPHYLVGLPVFYILLVVISLDAFRLNTKNVVIPGLILCVLFIANWNPISFVNSLSKPLFTGDASVYRNQLAVIDYIYENAAGKKFKYVVYTPPVHDYTYQYLFSWYAKNSYGYTPSETAKLAYFILEPDTQYPQRLIDWLKTREKDGVVENSKSFKSGIIVQTRRSD